MDDGAAGKAVAFEAQRVDEQVVGGLRQLADGAGHGRNRRPYDAESVDLRRARAAYADTGRETAHLWREAFASHGGELFGIAQAGEQACPEGVWEDDGGCEYGAGKRPAANLVNAGDAQVTLLPEEALSRPIRPRGHALGARGGLLQPHDVVHLLLVAELVGDH